MTLHRRTLPPACHTTGPATERCEWAWDRGAACGNASSPEQIRILLDMTPGCSRLERGLSLWAGVVEALVPETRGREVAA